MKNIKLPIGIFDSGLGGLTVLRALKKILPREQFIYFGDTAHIPYGNKSPQTVNKYCIQIIKFLQKQRIKLIIIACNTASSVGLHTLYNQTKIPIIDVISPVVKTACKTTKTKCVGIIGTETTIQSKEYQKQIKKINKNIKTIYKACPLFVPIIEEGLFDHKIAEHAAKRYLKTFKDTAVDTLILGCTHYPIMKNIIRKHLPKTIHIIDSPLLTANQVSKFLKQNNLNNPNTSNPNDQFYITDKVSRFNEIANMFLKKQIKNIKYIQL